VPNDASQRRARIADAFAIVVVVLTALPTGFLCIMPVNEYDGWTLDPLASMACDQFHAFFLAPLAAILMAALAYFIWATHRFGRRRLRTIAAAVCVALLVPSAIVIGLSIREEKRCEEAGYL
jgi:hypothetical protein